MDLMHPTLPSVEPNVKVYALVFTERVRVSGRVGD